MLFNLNIFNVILNTSWIIEYNNTMFKTLMNEIYVT